MMNDSIQFERSDAWLLLSVPRDDFAPLDVVIGAADMINRAIPIPDEIEAGFTRLIQADLVQQKDRQFRLTASGSQLVGKAERHTRCALRQWEFLEDHFSSQVYTPVCDSTFQLQDGEAQTAYKKYDKRARQIVAKIMKNG